MSPFENQFKGFDGYRTPKQHLLMTSFITVRKPSNSCALWQITLCIKRV